MSYHIGEATKEGLENEAELHLRHSSLSNPFVASPIAQLIPQPFGCFTYVVTENTWEIEQKQNHAKEKMQAG